MRVLGRASQRVAQSAALAAVLAHPGGWCAMWEGRGGSSIECPTPKIASGAQGGPAASTWQFGGVCSRSRASCGVARWGLASAGLIDCLLPPTLHCSIDHSKPSPVEHLPSTAKGPTGNSASLPSHHAFLCYNMGSGPEKHRWQHVPHLPPSVALPCSGPPTCHCHHLCPPECRTAPAAAPARFAAARGDSRGTLSAAAGATLTQ